MPVDPQRVVVLNSSLLDFALSLGVTPVGTVGQDAAGSLPAYLQDRVEGIETVGQTDSPNLEAIAVLRPDLILTSTLSASDELQDELNAIAPTVYTKGAGTVWRTDLAIAADALGRAEEARDALAGFDADARQVAESVGAESLGASIVRFRADEIRVYGPDSFSGGVLRTIGFGAPALDYNEFAIAYVSPELIARADADVMFTTTSGSADRSTRPAATAVWGTLRAIRSGCQFDVDDETWMIGIGLISARAILDDVERVLADVECGA